MEFNRVTLDFVNKNCSISLNGVNHLFSSVDKFMSLSGYPFTDTHLVFFEPERGIFVVERSGPITVAGENIEEIQWINSNRDNLIQAAHNDGYGNVELSYMPTLQQIRDQKLYETDWMVTRHRDQLDLSMYPTLSNIQYQNLLTYRQALRDITKVYNNLDDVVWPLLDI
jgi:hypothetical protein